MRANPASALAGDVIFTPSEASALTVKLVEQRQRDPIQAIRTSIPCIDAYMRPLAAGELMVVLGRPSNYKSGLMQYMARSLALDLQAREDPRCVIYVTWEQAIEEMTMFELASSSGEDAMMLGQGRVLNHDRLIASAMQRSALPLWLMGHSIERRRRRPRLSMTDVERGLAFAEDEWGMRPALIVLDYVQRIRPEEGYDTRSHVSANVERVKDLGLAMGCPVILGSQANRKCTERRVKIPAPEDSKETGNIEETADAIMAVFMPKTAEAYNSALPDVYALGENFVVTDELLLVSIHKRRFAKAGMTFPLRITHAENKVEDYN